MTETFEIRLATESAHALGGSEGFVEFDARTLKPIRVHVAEHDGPDTRGWAQAPTGAERVWGPTDGFSVTFNQSFTNWITPLATDRGAIVRIVRFRKRVSPNSPSGRVPDSALEELDET